MQTDHTPSVKRDCSPAEHDCSPPECDYPISLNHVNSPSLKHVNSPSLKRKSSSSLKCKSSPRMKRDGSPSLFNPVSESMVEVEETSGRDTISNLNAVLTINLPHSSHHGIQLNLTPSLEKPSEIPDARYRFFESEMRSERLAYFRTTALSTLVTGLVLLGILSIYWGTLWKLDEHAYRLRGIVVDFDQDTIGKAVLQAAQERTGSPAQITWTMGDSSSFNHDISNVTQAVSDEEYWVAIVVHPGSTQRLREAINSTRNGYDGTNAVTIYVSSARQETAYSRFILPQSLDILNSAKLSFRQQNVRIFSQTPELNLSKVMENVPQTISNPFDFRVNELIPFDVPIVSAMTALGLIYVTLAALISCNIGFQTRSQMTLRDKLTLSSFVQLRICSPLMSYLWISLAYTLLSVLFHVPFGRFRGEKGFMLCWLMLFLGMSALGLTIEVVTSLLTTHYVSYFMIFWVIWNISVCSTPVEMLPRVYRYAYISPFYNVNRAVRAIILGTKSDLVVNFFVQISWIMASSINIILCELWRRRKIKLLRKQEVGYV